MPVFDPLVRSPSGRLRARGWELPLPGTPGPLNAITDVPGVAVGFSTLADPTTPDIRTGVTAILPRPPEDLLTPVWAGRFSMNGNGEMTGTHWIDEAGWFAGPITLNNTLSLGIAHHATIRWMANRFRPRLEEKGLWLLPVAAETYDGWLNDIYGQHVAEAHVLAAIDGATGGAVAEGSVGGGTGMICYEYKGGTGTASRRLSVAGQEVTVGALVQANHGLRPWLTVCGRRVGDRLPGKTVWTREKGSIVAVIATDVPLLPIQMQRLARRAALGIGRGGTPSGNGSGDIFLAFSTANAQGPLPEPRRLSLEAIGNDRLDPIFLAVVEAVEGAVLNAMLAAESCTGRLSRTVEALPGAALAELLLSQSG